MTFNLFSGAPQDQAMLALASGMLESGGPSRTPVSLGQGAARGMMQGQEAFMRAAQAQQQQQLFDLKRQQLQAAQAQEAQRAAALGRLAQDPRFSGMGDLIQAAPQMALERGFPAPRAPVVVQPGASLVNPQDPSTPLFTSPDKQAIPASIREYEYAKAQGYKGSLQDFVTEQKRAGANQQVTNVNTAVPASVEAQKEFMKSTRVNYEAVRNAPTVLKNIEEAKALIPGAKGFMGPGGESLLEATKFLNNRLGTSIDTKGVKDAEELRSRVFFQLMENLKKMDAQPSQMQQVMMRDALGKLGTDPGALGAVLDAYGSVVRDKVSLHNKEVESAQSRGVQFPYDPLINLEQLGAPATPKDNAAPKAGEVRSGWVFLGGDPANRMSWRKQ